MLSVVLLALVSISVGAAGKDSQAALSPRQASALGTCVPTGTPGPFTQASPIPTSVMGAATDDDGTGEAGGASLYSAGGYSSDLGSATSRFARYDPVLDAWTILAPLPDSVYAASGVFANGKFYVIGGVSGGAMSTRNRIYDVAQNSWSDGSPLPEARQQAGAGFIDGKIYVVGGYGITSIDPFATLYEYDIASDSWATQASIPQGVAGPASGVIGDRLYIAGGRDGSTIARNTLYVYDPSTNSWSPETGLPTGVNYAAGAVANGKLWVMGGGNPFLETNGIPQTARPEVSSSSFNITQVYDAATHTWTAGPNLNLARSFTYGGFAGNYVIVVGGYNGTTSMASVERSLQVTGSCATPTATAAIVTATSTSTPTVAIPTSTSSSTNTSVPMATLTSTAVPTATSIAASATSSPTTTATSPLATSTATSVATATPCNITFTDVPNDHTFYSFIRCLACRGIISGYSDGTFKPGNEITRSQIAKMVSNAAGLDNDPGGQIFEDVDPTHTFYAWINRLSQLGYMGGYPCGTIPEEPCNPPDNRPYFRPFANATRGQLAKIVSNTAGIGGTPTGLYFTDVPEDHPFYTWIMRLTQLGVMGGYPCGGEGEPCDDQNRPYFRPFSNVTRGQASKIVANTFFPNCQTPSRQ